MSNLLLLITVSSHNFKITRISPRTKIVVEAFARKYVQRGLVRKPGGRYISEPIKVFASATSDREEYRFHINQLKDFYEHLKFNHVTENLYQVINNTISPGLDVDIKVKPQWIPRDDQIPILDYLTETNNNRAKLVGIQTGKGKAQPFDAKIKVPGGWKRMGDMRVGTQVIAKDGSISKVTGVFPQGQKRIYKITFSDGRSTECCAKHLWNIYYAAGRENKRWRTVNTLEVMRLLAEPNPKVYIDLVDKELSEDSTLVIDPYILGTFLAGGFIFNNKIIISNIDKLTFTEVSNRLPKALYLNSINVKKHQKCYSIESKNSNLSNAYFDLLRDLHLMNKQKSELFIPKEYLNSSHNQRLALLQGIFNLNGYCSADGNITISGESEQLLKNIQYLIRSIGGTASLIQTKSHYALVGSKIIAIYVYRLSIHLKETVELFNLSKKKERLHHKNQSLKLKIESVILKGKENCQCISIDHPDKLYITDDFIVTHNTLTSLLSIAELGKRTVIIIKPMFIDKWVEDLLKTYEIEPKDIMVVKGSGHLIALLELAKSGELDSKFIIISNKTIQNWLKLYEQYREGTFSLGYSTLPETLFQDLNAGIRLIDEVHMDFHLCFKIDLYTNIERSISLSATLVSNDDFVAKMHEVMHPTPTRYALQKLDQYINSYVVYYQFKDPTKIRTTEYGATSYSHTAFEKSIFKHKPTLNNYFNLIKYIIEIGFMKNARKKKKLMVFASTIEMCTLLTKYFSNVFNQYKVKRYVGEDPYSDLMTGDIIFTTLGSAGTAVDVPDLTNVILTVAVDSIQSNIQSLGRLRKLGPDDRTEFHYMTCLDIPKHLEYSFRKKEMLGRYAKTYSEIQSRHVV